MTQAQEWRKRPVIVVGVGQGLGTSLVKKFASEGCHVGALARHQDKLEKLVSRIRTPDGGKILPVACDATDYESVEEAFAEVRRWQGSPIGGVIYNASTASWTGLLDGTPTDFEQAWRVTTYGAFLCAKAAARDMVEHGGGFMLFTGATSSVRGREGAIGFSSAKFGLRGFVQSLAAELWPRNVHVGQIIIDGVIDTDHNLKPGRVGREEDPMLRPDDIAEAYWMLSNQPPSAWSLEIDVRPRIEKFFE